MKKTLVVGLAIGMVTMATAAFAARAEFGIPQQGNTYSSRTGATGWDQKNIGGDGIVGSSHDMSGVGTVAVEEQTSQTGAQDTAEYTLPGADRQDRICVYCHHPHNTIKGSATQYSPLWNRDLTSGYTGYNNGTMMSGGATASQHAINADTTGIKGVSLLCMSCHDGTVAMNAYSQTTGITDSTQGSGSNNQESRLNQQLGSTADFGKDLSNHHPMGFAYDEVAGTGAGKDNEIALSSTVMVPAGLTSGGMTVAQVTAAQTGGVKISDLLNGTGATATMECITCHDVHNTGNAQGAERFLWRSNNQSNFCLVCHLK